MQLIRRCAAARAGLMGNPSDGYHGKTLSVTVHQFHATAVLYEWEDVEIVLAQEDRSRFRWPHYGQRGCGTLDPSTIHPHIQRAS